jgi:hypothetical protein
MRRVLIVALLATAGCTTTFGGAAKVPNGAVGCKAICTSYGMELTGMVALGEYSDGCICQVPGKATASGAAGAEAVGAAVVSATREQRYDLRRSIRDMK